MDQFYFLSMATVRRMSVRKPHWNQDRTLHLETIEISPRYCCFEWEGGRDFEPGEEVDFHLDLEEGPSVRRGAILSVEECRLLDECYGHQVRYLYCAEFDAELEGDLFRSIIGPVRRCKSFF